MPFTTTRFLSSAAAVVMVVATAPASTAQTPVNVAGTYATAVTLLRNTCGPVTIEEHETIVTHIPGDTLISISHAGQSYAGRLNLSSMTFATTTKTIADPEGNIGINIRGSFTNTAINATVTVTIARTKPCRYEVRWAGKKPARPAAAGHDTERIPTQQQASVVDSFYRIRERTLDSRGTARDVEALLSLMSDSVRYEHPRAGITMTKSVARAGILKHLGEGVDVRISVQDLKSGPGFVVAEITTEYAGQKPFRGVGIFELRNGRISRIAEY